MIYFYWMKFNKRVLFDTCSQDAYDVEMATVSLAIEFGRNFIE